MPIAPRTPAVSIGECMVELARGGDGRFGLSYGGDTFNTAVYLARSGAPVRYATALGDDPYSAGILELARQEQIGTDLVHIAPGRMPGLYLIETSAGGERTFHYWRDRSPARELLDGPQGTPVLAAIATAPLVYLSSITLSLYADAALDRLAGALADARRAGAAIAMDGNYRPRGWAGDASRARPVISRFWQLATIALPTFDDEAMLWGDADPEATIARLAAHGIAEIAVKRGADGAMICADGVREDVPIPQKIAAIDTSAAGDSFNGAYLAARLAGQPPRDAALAGHRLAGIVVQHRGAIAPAAATAAVLARS